jgi:hypothetical protein
LGLEFEARDHTVGDCDRSSGAHDWQLGFLTITIGVSDCPGPLKHISMLVVRVALVVLVALVALVVLVVLVALVGLIALVVLVVTWSSL